MQVTNEGIQLIKNSEGFRPTPYYCPSGILSIGYGHSGKDVVSTMEITQDEAASILLRDIKSRASEIKKRLKVTLTDNQYSALVSHFYNCGYSETLFKLINAKKFKEASDWWLKHYVTDRSGKILPGLVKRRALEVALFNKK